MSLTTVATPEQRNLPLLEIRRDPTTVIPFELLTRGGRVGLVVKMTDSWPACHEFEPNTAEDLPFREDQCTLNLTRLKRSPIGMVWKLGEGRRQPWYRPPHLSVV
ncbi:hypothetical protein TNCV_3811741 [Trichonephila clavipes]|nr:hypothetical protein TNCV_3811741 [Trichonephila clavipes]